MHLLQSNAHTLSIRIASVGFILAAGFVLTANAQTSNQRRQDPTGVQVTSSNSGSKSQTAASQKGQLTLSPSTLSFGNVKVGVGDTQQVTLSASGAGVTITSAATTNSQFVLSGSSFPLTVAAGKSTQLNVVFTPQKAATVSGKLGIFSNATTSRNVEALNGTGTNPQVDLSWSPSTSVGVSGYNVYRGATAGSYAKVNPSLVPGTAYADTTAAPGATYYYAATAVDSSGEESGYSSPIEVAVP